MRNVTLTVIIDSIFTAFVTFLLSLVILNYATKPPYNVILALCFCALFTLIAIKFMYTSRKKKHLAEQERKHFELVMSELCYLNVAERIELFEKALISKGYTCVKNRNALLTTQTNALHFFFFHHKPINKTDVVRAYNRLEKYQKVVIWCQNYPPEVKNFADRFNGKIVLNCGKQAYTLLSSTNNLPQTSLPIQEQKQFPNVLQSIFDRKKAKKLAGIGLFFLITSYFLPFKLYYVIFGCLFLAISVIATLFGTHFEKSSPTNESYLTSPTQTEQNK